MPINQRGQSWQAAVTHNKKRLRKDFPTFEEAKRWHDTTLAALKAGIIPTEEPKAKIPTLKELLDKVYTMRWAGTKSEETTMINARHVVKVLGEDRLVSTLSKEDAVTLKETFRTWSITDATINRKLAAFSTLLKEAVEFGYIQKKFTVGLTKENGGRIRIFSPQEEADMLAWCDKYRYDDLKDYIIVSIDTGFRQGEVLKITASDVTGEDNLWTYDTKNGDSREVPLTDRAKAVLMRRAEGLRPRDKLFDQTARALRDGAWKKMQFDLGYGEDEEYTPHVLRHTWVTRLLAAGVDIKTVQEMAGHKHITTTQRYARSSPERKALAIKRLQSYQAA